MYKPKKASKLSTGFGFFEHPPEDPHWLGGTMSPPGPATPIDPDQFLERPSYRDAIEDTRPSRANIDGLKGRAPHSWIAEGMGSVALTPVRGGKYKAKALKEWPSSKAIYTQTDRRIVGKAKGNPLASAGAIARAKQSGEFDKLQRAHIINGGPVLQFAPNGRTNICSGSITDIVVYEADHYDPFALAEEIKRVGLPGAKVTLVGLGACQLDGQPEFEKVMQTLVARLRPYQTRGERSLQHEFRDFPLALEDSKYFATETLLSSELIKPRCATAKWTFANYLAYLRTYPVIHRIEHAYFEQYRLFLFDIDAMKTVWGNPKKVLDLCWPVYVRSGFLPS